MRVFHLAALAIAFSVTMSPSARGDAPPAKPSKSTFIDVSQFQIVKRESGPDNYYRVFTEGDQKFIRAAYQPPGKTTLMAVQLPDEVRQTTKTIEWRWRAQSLPLGGNDCVKGANDSAANIYITFKRGLKWYSLKYVWSTTGKKGDSCSQKRNPIASQDAILKEVGGPTGEWRTATIDPSAEYRSHFENGDQNASVPDLVGIGIMTDGDDTNSTSSADYGGFTLIAR